MPLRPALVCTEIMSIKAVLYSLDNTVLDRDCSLELYLAWEANEYLDLSPEHSEHYIQ